MGWVRRDLRCGRRKTFRSQPAAETGAAGGHIGETSAAHSNHSPQWSRHPLPSGASRGTGQGTAPTRVLACRFDEDGFAIDTLFCSPLTGVGGCAGKA